MKTKTSIKDFIVTVIFSSVLGIGLVILGLTGFYHGENNTLILSIIGTILNFFYIDFYRLNFEPR